MFYHRTSISVAFISSLCFASYQPAVAQSGDVDQYEANQIEEIIVTGSRIPRAGFESLQPATVLSRQTLNSRGSLDVAKNLNEQTGFIGPISPVGGQGATVGRNLVNFLGLGVQRTLTLVNGRRFPSTSAFNLSVDLNAIPETLVDRVETIAVGGAPIYGSDAIAGTVNIILRDDFEGFEISGSMGRSPEFNDGGETRLTGTWGTDFNDGRGNIAISAQAVSIEGLRGTDRPETETHVGFESPGDPNSPYALEYFDNLIVAVDNHRSFPLFFGDLFFLNVFGNGVPLDINDPASPLSQFDADGNMIAFQPGSGTGSFIFQQGGDGFRLAEYRILHTEHDRYNANLFLNYELTDSLRIDAELWYARTEAKQMVAQPYFNSNTFGGIPINNYGNVGQGPVPVLIDNPFLTDATRANMTAALNVVHDFTGDGVADPTIDTDGDGIPDAVGFWRGGPLNVAGDSDYWTEQDTYRVVLGLDGDVPFRDDTLLWDAAYTYGRVEIANSTVAIHQPNFEQAVQVTADANGMPACVDPSGGCAPLDVVGTPSQQAIDYVTQQVTDHTTTEQHIVSANIAGDVVEVPAGPLGAAIGALYRQENVKFDPNDLSRAGLTRFSSSDPLNERFSSTELYAEVLVPLLGGYMDIPLIDTLEFEGAIRYVDNSVVGSDTTWTVGLRYRPIDDIEFRGNITESIRAPSMGELFLPETVVFAFAHDPCDSRFITQGNVPDTRAANCAADGIVQPFQSVVVNASQQGVSGGNPNLDSEIAESISYGVVLRPRFWDQFTMSIDWFDIQIDNAIENLGLEDIMIACYDSSSFSSEPACDLFTRDAMGQIANFRTGFVNVAVIEFAGLQAVAQFNTELGRFGELDISLNYMFTERHEETPGSGNTQFYDGTVGISKHRVTMGITWDIGNWTWYNQLRWLDSAVFDNADDEFTRNISEIDDWLLVNSSLEYRFSDQFDVQLVIDNLFDTDPPFAAMSRRSISGVVYYPGILGRYARIQARYAF